MIPACSRASWYVRTFTEAAQTAAWTPAMTELMGDIEAAL